ncbi:MAG TPA: RluA family pseudouridine synthase [Gemmatales bacterium]|nr:RluA family pseudouridine synthase [Gemmatales bacterium]
MSSDQKPLGFQILFEDPQCLFVNKPAGVLTQAPPGIDSIERRIKSYLQESTQVEPYLGVPHRLDRAASGVMVFAKTTKAARRLAEQFQAKIVEKVYWALVEGKVIEQHGTWVDSMRKVDGEPRAALIPADYPEAKKAILHFIKRGQAGAITWLEIRLETGRTHQIRLQTGSRGHPILGDQLYGSKVIFGDPHSDERLRAIALHARQLTLVHPTKRQSMTIEAPPTDTWQQHVARFNIFS